MSKRSAIGHRRSAIVTLTLLSLMVAPVICTAQYSFEQVAAGLKHQDPATRIRAIQILKESNDPEAAGPIAAVLEDQDDRVQLEAIDAERALFSAKPVSRRKKVGFVVEVRTDTGAEVSAAGQLALLPRRVPTEVLWGLVAAMRDDSPRIRLDALNAFGWLAPLGGPEGTAAVRSGMSWTIEALRRGDAVTQMDAITVAGQAMRNCGEIPESESSAQVCAEVGNVLIDTINSRLPQVRRAAMQALGQLRYSYGSQALSDQLSYYQRGPDAEAALEGLARIGHESSASIFKRLLSHAHPTMRRLAVEGLARGGRPEDLADLEQLGQRERSSSVLLAWHFAAVTLGKTANPAAVAKPDQLVNALRDSSLRPLALGYLLELSPSIAPALVEFLRHKDGDTRRLIADVLGFSRDATVLPALEAAAKDPDADAAIAAKRAIDRINFQRLQQLERLQRPQRLEPVPRPG